eukprot:CAMPEP_0172301512 /NCGR_PEP_ID=MMETSP1058-20130122/3388_1 /TAXON_ID=83371 /ORGANISM="Detonula confervacea, Strain CCMP 353" /LENGTH=425 /DNA_ID=CAMNT_0013011655 /DNA_START=269 /DNA_END=1543 /DNA_ORIENTATION=-
MAAHFPSTSQQRALAYAQKPFAAISFLSTLFVMYYLLIRHPEKRKRLYHRLILATFCCFMPLSFAMFLGTWVSKVNINPHNKQAYELTFYPHLTQAMPAGTPWAVGTSGTSLTCSIQGFVEITFYLAFPFYYASFSILAYLSVKSNFKEENYAWIEKWIHIGAYLLPLTVSIVAAVNGWINPGLSTCTLNIPGKCGVTFDPNCHHVKSSRLYGPLAAIVMIELLIGTVTIVFLLCTFEKIQKEVDGTIGMKRIVEKARKRRLKEVAVQTGLYIISFWFGYVPKLIETFARFTAEEINYELITFSNCIFAFQGFIILVIYFALQQKSRRESTCILPGPAAERDNAQETVSKIRANAAMPRSPTWKGSLSRFSFHIFDGTPEEDSPFAAYFDDDLEDSGLSETVSEQEENGPPENSLVTSLLADDRS